MHFLHFHDSLYWENGCRIENKCLKPDYFCILKIMDLNTLWINSRLQEFNILFNLHIIKTLTIIKSYFYINFW